MPIQVSYPGVYVEEIPGGQPVVSGVSTASTAFVDFFARGPMNEAVRITDMQAFERTFGGLDKRSEASYGLSQYFLNGGQEAWVVRTGDGSAVASTMSVPIKTPGLQARVKYSADDYQKARDAATSAQEAADKAAKALSALQEAKTDQETDQGLTNLQGSTSEAAKYTQEAAEATREAAVQARAASDELALAIAKAAAASGPTASRSQMAAQSSADAAQASADAAQQTNAIAAVAQRTDPVATNALKISNRASAAQMQADQAVTALTAADKAEDAAKTAAKENDDNKDGDNFEQVQQAAGRASSSATEAARQAMVAAEAALTAARSLEEGGADGAPVDDAKKTLAAAREQATEASKADWGAQTASDLDGAKKALQQASDVAAAAAGVAAGGDAAPSGVTSAKDLVTTMLKTISDNAKQVATDAADVASDTAGKDASSEPVGKVVDDAIAAIDSATQAAKDAAAAASAGAKDAKVAADSVASPDPALAARSAEGAVIKAGKESDAAIENAKDVKMKIFQANSAALAAGSAAGDAVKNAKDSDDPKQLAQDAADLAQKGLNAANDTVTAAESVEKAAVSVSRLSVAASKSADGAAQAAEAAVVASEEASQGPELVIAAINPGAWGDNLSIDLIADGTTFTLQVSEIVMANGVTRTLRSESYNNLTVDETDTSAVPAVATVNGASNMIRLTQYGLKVPGAWPQEVGGKFLEGGKDGGLANANQLTDSMLSLEDIEPNIFNILCLPAVANYNDSEASVAIAQAQSYAAKKRAFFIADIPQSVNQVSKMLDWVNEYGNAQAFHMGVYFPRLVIPDPLDDYRPRNIPSSGTVAGIYARTDSARGVWKAPAGVDAVIQGAEVAVPMTDDLNGQLNPRGVNVLRQFPVYGNIVWGARTLAGADALSSEYKYVNVRRLMNYVEESIFQSIKWAVFEPNDETLWGKIRLQLNGFLSGLFSSGAFQGATAAQAYFVRCDGTTTTPLDIDMGVVNVVVGIAPSKPAEFVVLQFQQIAGQSA